jgi:hypothetical protein
MMSVIHTQALFAQAYPPALANYQVVQHLDLHQLARLDERPGYGDILGTGMNHVSAGVEMCMFVLRMFVGT